MPSSTCHFDLLNCQLMCGFFFTSHSTCRILNRVRQLMCILFLCKFLRVKWKKLAKTLSKIHNARVLSNCKIAKNTTQASGAWLIQATPVRVTVADDFETSVHLHKLRVLEYICKISHSCFVEDLSCEHFVGNWLHRNTNSLNPKN